MIDPGVAVEMLTKLIDVMPWRHQNSEAIHRPLLLSIENGAHLLARKVTGYLKGFAGQIHCIIFTHRRAVPNFV